MLKRSYGLFAGDSCLTPYLALRAAEMSRMPLPSEAHRRAFQARVGLSAVKVTVSNRWCLRRRGTAWTYGNRIALYRPDGHCLDTYLHELAHLMPGGSGHYEGFARNFRLLIGAAEDFGLLPTERERILQVKVAKVAADETVERRERVTVMAKNVELAVKGTKLTVTVDLSKRFGKSASGKTIIIASTEGNVKVGDDESEAVIGLNVYTKKGLGA